MLSSLVKAVPLFGIAPTHGPYLARTINLFADRSDR
jgi:hypothetical protein